MEVEAQSSNNPMSRSFYVFPDGFDRRTDEGRSTETPLGPVLPDYYGHSEMFGFQIPDVNMIGVNPDTTTAMQLFVMNHIEDQERGSSGLSLSLNSNLQQRIEIGRGVNVGAGGPMGVGHVLRQSRYARAAQELLRDFCGVSDEVVKKGKRYPGSYSSNPNPNSDVGNGGASSSCNSKDPQRVDIVLSPSERLEQQRTKAKFMAMLDEVDRRYNHYCEQMQAVVNSFDSVMGFGAAAPYTALAQNAMSRHFRCMRDAVAAQLKKTCKILGEKDCSLSTGFTKGETPRRRLLDLSLRNQRAFHRMGMSGTEAWQPQRGLPQRSVSILRAWLFEHFLHPYPSDADKHLLSRQTGLSRNQVSNWFINARVRLWKPMIEEMYQQEAEEEKRISSEPSNQRPHSPSNHQLLNVGPAQNTSTSHPKPLLINKQEFQIHPLPPSSSSLDNHASLLSAYQSSGNAGGTDVELVGLDLVGASAFSRFDMSLPDYGIGMLDHDPGQVQFKTRGDVSLTLGLRHAGNAKDSNQFSMRDFGGM